MISDSESCNAAPTCYEGMFSSASQSRNSCHKCGVKFRHRSFGATTVAVWRTKTRNQTHFKSKIRINIAKVSSNLRRKGMCHQFVHKIGKHHLIPALTMNYPKVKLPYVVVGNCTLTWAEGSVLYMYCTHTHSHAKTTTLLKQV